MGPPLWDRKNQNLRAPALDATLRVLIINDSEDDMLLLLRRLRQGGYAPVPERVATLEAMGQALETGLWDVVIFEYAFPEFSEKEALALLRERELDLPFILVAGDIETEHAVAAMRAGVHDCLCKGKLTRLPAAVEQQLRKAAKRRERKCTEEEHERHRQHLEDLAAERTADLQAATVRLHKLQAEKKILEGLLPICPACKKIHDEASGWHELEAYLTKHPDVRHGICPECARKLSPELYDDS